MTGHQLAKYIINKNTLSNLNRDHLISFAKQIGIKDNFNNPYKKKDDIIRIIELKTVRKSRKKIKTDHQRQTQRGGLVGTLNLKILNNLRKLIPYHINYDNLDLNLQDYYPQPEKLFVLGDVHGDLMATIESLRIAKLISIDCNPLKVDNNKLVNCVNWIGGKAFLIQMGDQIDRTRPENWDNNQITIDNAYHDEGSDLKIMELFDKLGYQAQKTGGCVISLLGNHELMNVDGDFRYVSLNEFREFGNRFRHLNCKKSSGNYPFGYSERKEVFQPGGLVCQRMARNRKAVVQIGNWVFVHGGFVPESAIRYSIKDINHIVKQYLMGVNDSTIRFKYNDLFNNDDGDFSPFWSRKFGYPEDDDQHEFSRTIQALNIKNKDHEPISGMLIGHTPQFFNDKPINSSFNNKLWRVDVGVSKAFGPRNNKGNNVYRKIQILYMKDGQPVSVLH